MLIPIYRCKLIRAPKLKSSMAIQYDETKALLVQICDIFCLVFSVILNIPKLWMSRSDFESVVYSLSSLWCKVFGPTIFCPNFDRNSVIDNMCTFRKGYLLVALLFQSAAGTRVFWRSQTGWQSFTLELWVWHSFSIHQGRIHTKAGQRLLLYEALLRVITKNGSSPWDSFLFLEWTLIRVVWLVRVFVTNAPSSESGCSLCKWSDSVAVLFPVGPENGPSILIFIWRQRRYRIAIVRVNSRCCNCRWRTRSFLENVHHLIILGWFGWRFSSAMVHVGFISGKRGCSTWWQQLTRNHGGSNHDGRRKYLSICGT